jgi:trimeric autotransporter adhesin
MSTKTTFKRIALVAVAALGLGVLSVAPSTAGVSSLTVTTANGTSANSTDGGASDSRTAATVTINALIDAPLSDSITVTFVRKSAPSGNTAVAFAYFMESTTSAASSTYVDSLTAATPVAAVSTTYQRPVLGAATGDTATRAIGINGTDQFRLTKGNTSAGYVGAKFAVQLDSMTARIAGTYTYTAIVKSWTRDAAGNPTSTTTTADLSIVVAAAAQDDTVVLPSSSTATMSRGATWAATDTDSSVALVSTVSATDQAIIRVITKNANGNSAAESITATVTGAGVIGLAGGSTFGKNITVAGSGSTDLAIRADGTAGTGSIVIKTTSVTFPAKTVTFFAKSAKTITLAVNKPVIGVGAATDVIRATAVDADGNVWGGAAYIYASAAADALIAGSETPAACTFNSARGYHECPVSGTAAGTANFKVIDAATVALATATSASAAVRVTVGVPATAKLAFDKATYAPGEKAQIWVTAVDAAGLALSERTITNLFATGGITSTSAFSTGSDTTLTDVTVAIAGATSATAGTVAGYKVYTVYMPYASGDITISATGGTGLAAAGRVALSATASVVNSSVDAATDAANEATDAANAATDAALAAADAADAATAAAQDASDAVAALSASVSKLISSLRAQITSLTNLVIKIQKKVRA